MNSKDRLLSIDTLRALGIILMILTHVLSWHFGDYGVIFTWNSIHMVVVGLVFCSAYLYAKSNTNAETHHHLKWFTKRVERLYLPFLYYLIAHYTLWILFPNWLRGFGIKQTLPFVLSSITLFGGVDIGWLPTLFIQMAIIFPFLLNLARTKKLIYIIVTFLILFTLFTAFSRIPTDYTRLIGWLPWSLIAIVGFLYSDVENYNASRITKFSVSVSMICVSVYTALYFLLHSYHISVQLTDHKYPPDIFYLSYGLFFTCILITLFRKYESILYKAHTYITFISRESYSIFFIHIIVLDIVMTRFSGSWLKEFLIITTATLLCVYGISIIRVGVRRHLSKASVH